MSGQVAAEAGSASIQAPVPVTAQKAPPPPPPQRIAEACGAYERGMVGIPMGGGMTMVSAALLTTQSNWRHALLIESTRAVFSVHTERLTKDHGFVPHKTMRDVLVHPDTQQTVRLCTPTTFKAKGGINADKPYKDIDLVMLHLEGGDVLRLPRPLPARRWWMYTAGMSQASLFQLEQQLAVIDPQVSVNLAIDMSRPLAQRFHVDVVQVERKRGNDLMASARPSQPPASLAGNRDLGKLTDAKLDALLLK
jgi:hypothetical protein